MGSAGSKKIIPMSRPGRSDFVFIAIVSYYELPATGIDSIVVQRLLRVTIRGMCLIIKISAPNSARFILDLYIDQAASGIITVSIREKSLS